MCLLACLLACVRLSPTYSLGSVSSSLRARATDEIVIFSVPVILSPITLSRFKRFVPILICRELACEGTIQKRNSNFV